MRPINVVLAYHDALSAERLAASLRNQFRSLAIAKSYEEPPLPSRGCVLRSRWLTWNSSAWLS